MKDEKPSEARAKIEEIRKMEKMKETDQTIKPPQELCTLVGVLSNATVSGVACQSGNRTGEDTMTPPTAASKKGIAIQEALSILSDRAKTGEHISNSKSVPDELKGRGQTIDISEELEFKNPANFSACECATGAADNDDSENSGDSVQDARHEAMKQARIERGEEIKSKVRSMSISDLLGMIFGAQQERVSTYKIYEE